jgi:hypothetical protein
MKYSYQMLSHAIIRSMKQFLPMIWCLVFVTLSSTGRMLEHGGAVLTGRNLMLLSLVALLMFVQSFVSTVFLTDDLTGTSRKDHLLNAVTVVGSFLLGISMVINAVTSLFAAERMVESSVWLGVGSFVAMYFLPRLQSLLVNAENKRRQTQQAREVARQEAEFDEWIKSNSNRFSDWEVMHAEGKLPNRFEELS